MPVRAKNQSAQVFWIELACDECLHTYAGGFRLIEETCPCYNRNTSNLNEQTDDTEG